MGKLPRNRKKNRADPTAKPVKPPSDPELAAIRTSKILPVLQDLQSADQAKRSSAATAIANIVEDTKCRKLFLREQIVRILLEQTLTDASMETRIAGWGIMRNLALEEEADFCVHLYRQDILTAIEGAVKSTIDSKDTPVSKLPKSQQDLVWNLTSSVVTLLTSLSEADFEIVDAISKLSTIINFLFGLLSFDDAPTGIQNEALSCLAALTEDNKALAEFITEQGDWLNLLVRLKDSGGFQAVASCGVLHNIFSNMNTNEQGTSVKGASDAILLPKLVETIQQAHDQTSNNGANGANGHTAHSSPDRILQMALEITASIATSLQEALELANGKEEEFEGFGDEADDEVGDDIGEDEDDLDEAAMSDSDDPEMTQEEIEADMDMVLGDDQDDEETSDDQDTLHQLVRIACPAVIMVARPSQNMNSSEVQSQALAALNNIAWTVSSIDFSQSHLSSLQNIWTGLAQRIWDEVISPVLSSNTADIELATAITSIAWAVCRSVQGRITLRADEHRKFMALYHASKNIATPAESPVAKKDAENLDDTFFQALGVKCIGVLGRLALDPAPVELNREVGVFLMTLLSGIPETPAAIVVEALNEIFDIYADKDFSFDEPVFWNNRFDKHLEEVLPKCKKMAKTIDKRKAPELRSRVDEAVMNLARFLKYKKSEKGT
ncbi:ARM-like repeat-containing protein [Rutstroemia sp. NJR-2017a WRK4]|nr:ARM-like repeat-containing protein [Rutstroemia sp. NJR-2017a WRK4]